MNLEIITTNDGSNTLFVPELNERYHSIHGAIQESRHVFIRSGLNYFLDKYQKKDVAIFEVGFGTGLNTFLTLIESEKQQLTIKYSAIESYPLTNELWSRLNYIEQINDYSKEQLQFFFNQIHLVEWEKYVEVQEKFILQKINSSLLEFNCDKKFDIIYFDAFAPTVQPELWTKEIFKKLYDVMNVNGILVTYCAKGIVKRTLKEVGFFVESIQGPPGKREMIRAHVDI